MVVQIGIQFYSGDPAEAGAFAGPVRIEVLIDTITDGTGAVVVPPAGVSYTFDTATQGFACNNYTPTDGKYPHPTVRAHAILGLVFLDRRDFRNAAKHLRLAAADSEKARAILQDPPPGLKRALRPR